MIWTKQQRTTWNDWDIWSDSPNPWGIAIVTAVIVGTVVSLLSGVSIGTVSSLVSEDPDVILITLESTRVDHLGPCYGYPRNTTPSICQIANDGIRFTNAYSQGPATWMAIPSMLTGMLPNSVGLRNHTETLAQGIPTVSAYLETYDKIAYTEEPEFFAGSNFDKGFNSYHTNTSFKRAIQDHEDRNPLLAWYFPREQAHDPYDPGQEYRTWDTVKASSQNLSELTEIAIGESDVDGSLSMNDLKDLYDGELKELDNRIDELIELLKHEGRYKDAMIIVTADHGEALGDNGKITHAGEPDQVLIKTPLIIKLPNNHHAGAVIEQPVRHMDILPTINDYLNIDTPSFVVGESLLPAIHTNKQLNLTPISAQNKERNWMVVQGQVKNMVDDVERYCDPIPSTTSRYEAIQLIDDVSSLYRVDNLTDQTPINTISNLAVANTTYRHICDFYEQGLQTQYDQTNATFDWSTYPYS